MTGNFGKLKEVFSEALTKTSGLERTVFLDQACGTAADFRHRIDELIVAHEQADPLLDRPAAELLDSSPADDVEQADALSFLAPPTKPNSLGRLGHYEILEVLGQGGFGIVFRGFDERLQRVVAIKVLNREIAATSPARKRFLREARSSAKVRHENVVHIYAVEEQPVPYLVMEFIPGETLQQRIDRSGPLDAAEVAQIGRQIAEGLAAAHAEGLIHRDIKPANILIESGPKLSVKITDFGMARAVDDASVTQSGCIGGTPLFMSPEQAKGETLDHRTDLFSLGSVLYAACTGRPPFRAEGSYAILKRVAEDTPRSMREIIPEVPAWLYEIVQILLAKDPQERPTNAEEVATMLARGSGSDGRVNPKSSVRPQRRMSRWAIAAAALLAVTCLGIAEATDLTNFSGTIIRMFSPEGTLVVEVDDPDVNVKIDGSELVITGAGAKEIRLKPGNYTVEASKDGKLVSRELITVTNKGRKSVRVSLESPATTPGKESAALVSPAASEWEKSVAKLPRDKQLPEIRARLKALNPDFREDIQSVAGSELSVVGQVLPDISPVRAYSGLAFLHIDGGLGDIEALRGLKLKNLMLCSTKVSDLSPLKGMGIKDVDLTGSRLIDDIAALSAEPLEHLGLAFTAVSDLTPLKRSPPGSSKLSLLSCDSCPVKDLSPLAGLPLTHLFIHNTQVSDLSALKGMPLDRFIAENSLVNDEGLVHLATCRSLSNTSLKGTKVTAEGIGKLKDALPRCRIEWDGGVIEPR